MCGRTSVMQSTCQLHFGLQGHRLASGQRYWQHSINYRTVNLTQTTSRLAEFIVVVVQGLGDVPLLNQVVVMMDSRRQCLHRPWSVSQRCRWTWPRTVREVQPQIYPRRRRRRLSIITAPRSSSHPPWMPATHRPSTVNSEEILQCCPVLSRPPAAAAVAAGESVMFTCRRRMQVVSSLRLLTRSASTSATYDRSCRWVGILRCCLLSLSRSTTSLKLSQE